MGAVDVGIGEQDDLVIARLFDVEILPDAGAHGGEMSCTSVFCRALASRAFSTLRILPRMGRIAWVLESVADLAGPAADLPSTMNSSTPRVPR